MSHPQHHATSPELERITLGFVPLLDATLLIVARERGCFAAQGLDVSLSRENAWATLRDKVAAGLLDGAQMLAPMPLAMSLGLGRAPCETLAPALLSRNGNTITLSTSLSQASGATLASDPADSALALGNWLRGQGSGKRPRLAMVYPYSCQHYQLREWLTLGDIAPDRDVELVALPPPRMVEALRDGQIDGFCAGEPWGTLARHCEVGRLVTTGAQLWPNHPEKVLGVTRSWAQRYPATLAALLRALRDAGEWLYASPEHRRQALEWLALPPYLDRSVRHLQTLAHDEAPIHQQLCGPDVLRPTPQAALHFAAPIVKQLEEAGGRFDPALLAACYSPVHFDAATHH
ncbi:ABC transporter substrate-binding protein [Halomonas sp. LR3S48]|uniref:CmpA/NrtA family ABC transporter substrate-binding protein n=1 Tax=Halomonas sp. LR3S48 TaxID=2982694 RepID=UPI0021E42466|nr:CmpA/NrtA family ABC transporter substrate-binding protein [Halomonas sp. LR3S48]UYG04961.1 ABC transporter substrate-binding protein [Halomonas sp. LR3S48]